MRTTNRINTVRKGSNGTKLGKVLTVSCASSLIFLWAPPARSQPSTSNFTSGSTLDLLTPAPGIWQGGVGEGFRSSVQTFSVEAGVAFGDVFGHRQNHDLALTSLSYGHMLGPVHGEGHWYRGNLEWRGELFGGGQYQPSSGWLVGPTPHLRYNFATGTRWIPYFDGGVGVSATSIGKPDLGGRFEFNLRAAAGVHWFIHDDLALTCEAGYGHLSCCGIYSSNRGINDVAAMIGLTKFF